MREILAKTRFGDDIFLHWEFRQGIKFYYDISGFWTHERNYDAYASLIAFLGTLIRQPDFWEALYIMGFLQIDQLALSRIPVQEMSRIAVEMRHRTSLDVASYGRTLLIVAFRLS